MGYNDIDGGTDASGADLVPAEGAYKTDLTKVVGTDGGATSAGRRVLLILPHNWGRSPFYVRNGGSTTMNKRTAVWDTFVAKQAAARQNVIAVDLYNALGYVFTHYGQFGFTNITVADHAHSGTTAFFDDDFHPGSHAQHLIEEVIEYYLTGGWDWANTIKDPASAKAKLQAALDAGEVFGVPSSPPAASAAPRAAQPQAAQPQAAPAPAPSPRLGPPPTLAQLQATPEHFGVAWTKAHPLKR